MSEKGLRSVTCRYPNSTLGVRGHLAQEALDDAGARGRAGQGSGYGFSVQGSGYRVQGSEFRVQGSGFRVQGLGFRVKG